MKGLAVAGVSLLITSLSALPVLGAPASASAQANRRLRLCETFPCNKPSEAPVGAKSSEEMKVTVGEHSCVREEKFGEVKVTEERFDLIEGFTNPTGCISGSITAIALRANGKVYLTATQLLVFSVPSPKCEYEVTKLKIRFAFTGQAGTGRTEGSGSGKALLISGESTCPRKTGIVGTLVVRAEATHEPFWIREF